LSALVILHASPAASQSFSGYAVGTVDYMTSFQNGLMIRLSGGVVPQNCASPAEPMILIPQANQAMIAFVMSRVAAGKRDFVVYTHPTTGGYCNPWQISISGAI
jgi:hypothetical protein